MSREAVRLVGVSKNYDRGGDRITALVDVGLTVENGEFLVVTGPSGCGKSTLLHVIGAMDSPSGGEVFLGDRELSRLDDAELSRIRMEEVGFIYQFFNLLPTMTARENVSLPLLLQNRSRKEIYTRVEKALGRVGMSHRMDHLPRQLSGGEMQRVAIARAVIGRPRLILADEPTGNLDSRLGREVHELLSELCKEEGFTIIMASHAPESRDYATRGIQMLDGRILEEV